jgi:amino acid permease
MNLNMRFMSYLRFVNHVRNRSNFIGSYTLLKIYIYIYIYIYVLQSKLKRNLKIFRSLGPLVWGNALSAHCGISYQLK